MVDDLLHRLDSFLDGEDHLVVLAADVSRHLTKGQRSKVTLGQHRGQRSAAGLTFRAASRSGLSSEPMEKVWRGYCSFSSLASFVRVAATRLESTPPEEVARRQQEQEEREREREERGGRVRGGEGG